MKKNIILLCLAFVASFTAKAAEETTGIQFEHGTWSQAVEKAKAENKLIFVDFYTQWCGPCMNMAEEVFVLPTVGEFYNTNFVNLKIDAENGEGVDLAKKYGVRSYPTYAFIDPATQEAVHMSSSRQTGPGFIKTGANAKNPSTRSFYLIEQFEKGNRDKQFLSDYIEYMKSTYKTDNVSKAFDILIAQGATLEQPEIWTLFVETINGPKNPYIKQVSDNYTKFVALYGKKAVDEKLAKETTYLTIEELNQFCDYEGKRFNREMIELNGYTRAKEYDKAITKIDALIADTTVNRQALIDRLKFIVRGGVSENSPANWSKKCLEYLQFIAYNNEDRRDSYVHYEYGAALEKYIKMMNNKVELPASVLDAPKVGKSNYNMRSDKLKMKPAKKK